MRLTFYFAVALFAAHSLSGQTAILRGQVTDESGAVIPGAKVSLKGPSGAPKTTTADAFCGLSRLAEARLADGRRKAIVCPTKKRGPVARPPLATQVTGCLEVEPQAELHVARSAGGAGDAAKGGRSRDRHGRIAHHHMV